MFWIGWTDIANENNAAQSKSVRHRCRLSKNSCVCKKNIFFASFPKPSAEFSRPGAGK